MEVLGKALLFKLITELEQDAESFNSSSDTCLSSSSEDEDEGASHMEDPLHSMAALYKDHYHNTHPAYHKDWG